MIEADGQRLGNKERDAMHLVNKAIWAIERRLVGEVTLDAVAAACGASPSHLAHVFSAGAGTSVVAYARARRLSLAAEALANGGDDIFAVALDTGYSSHEAFTRAFRAAFGKTPEEVRAAGTTDGLALTAPLPYLNVGPALSACPERFVSLPERRAVGLVERLAHGDVASIPLQWGRFMQRYAEIDDKSDPIPWGVAFHEADGFDYACAALVSRIGDVPEGLRALRLPACDYAVYRHDGHISRIAETYAAICGDAPKSERPLAGPTLEQHAPDFDTKTGFGGVFIYMPAFA
ncbi:MAG: AraC family transcriptional regulator [Parvularculaceae bacterium]|nr:AraC family transcriptional regulator [Parvularculaceae bacterium]